MKRHDYSEMDAILSDYLADPAVQSMRKYVQHGAVTTLEHCESVARLCFDVNKSLSLHADLHALLIGALLHDFYLYDWHHKDGGTHRLHGFRHAAVARANARKFFHINDKIGEIISCHMWPLNPGNLPRSKEAWIVCIADKCVSLYETIHRR